MTQEFGNYCFRRLWADMRSELHDPWTSPQLIMCMMPCIGMQQ